MTVNLAVLQERIDELAGVRRKGANIGRAAVRLNDINEIMRIPEVMQAETASGSVSVDDFNALLKDVRELHTALRAVANNMRLRRGL